MRLLSPAHLTGCRVLLAGCAFAGLAHAQPTPEPPPSEPPPPAAPSADEPPALDPPSGSGATDSIPSSERPAVTKPAPAPTPSSPAAPAPTAAPSAAPPRAPAPSDAFEPGGLVEWLPSQGYPAWHVRGLEGGSLWSTFHGMSWPYYPRTGVALSGYGWVDTGYEHVEAGNPADVSNGYVTQQGRLVLRVTPTYSRANYFAQAQAEVVASKDQSVPPNAPVADDVWLRVGRWKQWDVTVGRFEAFEIYHFGLGLDLNTLERRGAFTQNSIPPDIYGATYLFYRQPTMGNVALHAFPLEVLRFELLGQVGNDVGQNGYGVRPAGVLDLGFLKVKGAGEYRRFEGQSDEAKDKRFERGFAGAVQVVWDPYLEAGFNFGTGLVDRWDVTGKLDPVRSGTTVSYGGFVTVRPTRGFGTGPLDHLLLGGGVNFTSTEDLHREPARENRPGEFSHFQAFGAVQYRILPPLYVKVVVAHAAADFEPSFSGTVPPWSNEMLSTRLRVQYLF